MVNEGENLTGIKKYLNSTTDYGRGNTAKLTMGTLGLIILYNVLKPKKKPAAEKTA